MSDWEYSDESCPKCGEQMVWQPCFDCEDGVWEETDCNGTEYNRCDNCFGRGHHKWCRECGWDNVSRQFLSDEDEQAYLEKHALENARAVESDSSAA